MGYIKINTKYPVYDGAPITFRAPCDCTAADGISVNSKNFVFKDAHGVALTGMGNLFLKDAVVKVILDVTNSCAYIQNADTNSYLENKDADCVVNHYELPKQFLYKSDGKFGGSLTWSVREWQSGYVECFGYLYIPSLELISYVYGGVHSCSVDDTVLFGPHQLPVALNPSYNYTIQASAFSSANSDFVMISLGRWLAQDSTGRPIITHTPDAKVWSPIQQSITGCNVTFRVTGHKFVD